MSGNYWGVMEYNIPYTAKTLMDRLGLKSRETFRRNYLHPAMEQGLVRMSIPDKPQSRNQRYEKVGCMQFSGDLHISMNC